MSDTNKTSEISLRLANIEKIINLFFEMSNSSTNILIEKKLAQFEDVIALYPDSAKNLADEARDKVVSMWYRFYNSASSSQKSLSESEDSGKDSMLEKGSNSSEEGKENGGSKSDLKNDSISSNKIEPIPKNDETLSFFNFSTLPKRRLLPNARTVYAEDTFDWRFELRQFFEKSFAGLKVVESGVDVEGIKELLRVTARAKYELSRYPKDTHLHFNIFNMAFSKLSLNFREHFLSMYGFLPNGINLENLVALLEAEIVAQHTKKVNLMKTIQHLNMKRAERPSNLFSCMPVALRQGYSIPFCKYCKCTDHDREHCPNIKKLLCFRCYDTGHTKPWCPLNFNQSG